MSTDVTEQELARYEAVRAEHDRRTAAEAERVRLDEEKAAEVERERLAAEEAERREAAAKDLAAKDTEQAELGAQLTRLRMEGAKAKLAEILDLIRRIDAAPAQFRAEEAGLASRIADLQIVKTRLAAAAGALVPAAPNVPASADTGMPAYGVDATACRAGNALTQPNWSAEDRLAAFALQARRGR